MISYRKADLLTNIRYRDTEIVITAKVGQSSMATEGYFVLFERPVTDNPEIREIMDARLRGILEAKSYKKINNNFVLNGIPSKERAEQEFFDVLSLFKSHNSIISVAMDPYTWLPGTRIKQFVMRMRIRG